MSPLLLCIHSKVGGVANINSETSGYIRKGQTYFNQPNLVRIDVGHLMRITNSSEIQSAATQFGFKWGDDMIQLSTTTSGVKPPSFPTGRFVGRVQPLPRKK